MLESRPTALYDWHRARQARMVDFAGYSMPLHYREGIIEEHLWTRAHASLFDVSHMGQIRVGGADAEARLESLMPLDCLSLPVGKLRYCLLLNDRGTIEDDLVVTRRDADFHLVVNAARKADDFARLAGGFDDGGVTWWQGRSLLALQGPEAVSVVRELDPGVADLGFMEAGAFKLCGTSCWVGRCGYTGEDGLEISLPDTAAPALADVLVADERVRPAGLGARDSLRLEAGFCLYGQDIDASRTPVEAGLSWTIRKARRPGGARGGGYPGAAVIERQLETGPDTIRVGLRVKGRLPVRAGSPLFAAGEKIGLVTSGGFAPSLAAPLAMGYVATRYQAPGRVVTTKVRGREVALEVAALPFVKKRARVGIPR